MTKWSKTTAFTEVGVAGANGRWNWSGRSKNGTTVALTFWQDLFRKGQPLRYIDEGWSDDEAIVKSLGNRERIENIKWALAHCGGVVGVVIATAKNMKAKPREGKDWEPKTWKMHITSFNEATGEYCAEMVA
jgi:hypothetical protein